LGIPAQASGKNLTRPPMPQTVGLNIAANIKEQFNTKPDGCDCCSVLMETDWQVSNDTVVRPDVMVICQEINETVMVYLTRLDLYYNRLAS
jgi:hypothetical protein